MGLATLLIFLLVRSPWGRIVKAIREDEDAVRALGKNVYSYKMQSLVIGGVIGAVGGAFWVTTQASITPGQLQHRAHLLRLRGAHPRGHGPGGGRSSARWCSGGC